MWIRGKDSTQNYLLKFIHTKDTGNPQVILLLAADLTVISTSLWILFSGKRTYQKRKMFCE